MTGGLGTLGSALYAVLKKKGEDVFVTDTLPPNLKYRGGFAPLDVCDAEAVRKTIAGNSPELVIHLAAATDVDGCEAKPKQAFKINVQGAENVARACREFKAAMLYVSTAEVYDGEKNEPYVETDRTNPVNVYGRTKLEGEDAVRKNLKDYYILRTAWLVGGGKKDKKFVGKMVEKLKTQAEVLAVDDKFGSPTFVKDLSRNIAALIDTKKYGLYHMCNLGGCSRFEMTKKIAQFLGAKTKVVPVSSDRFPLPAPRGRSEILKNANLIGIGLNLMPPWEKALKEYIQNEY